MKKILLMLVITGFLLTTIEIQAQTPKPKLNQVELMKQLIGNWKVNMSKDTIYYVDIRPFGTGLEFKWKTMVQGKNYFRGEGILWVRQ